MAIAKVIGAFFEDAILGTCTAYYWGGRWYLLDAQELHKGYAKEIVAASVEKRATNLPGKLCGPNEEPPIDPETGVIFYVEYQPSASQALRGFGRAAQAIGGV